MSTRNPNRPGLDRLAREVISPVLTRFGIERQRRTATFVRKEANGDEVVFEDYVRSESPASSNNLWEFGVDDPTALRESLSLIDEAPEEKAHAFARFIRQTFSCESHA